MHKRVTEIEKQKEASVQTGEGLAEREKQPKTIKLSNVSSSFFPLLLLLFVAGKADGDPRYRRIPTSARLTAYLSAKKEPGGNMSEYSPGGREKFAPGDRLHKLL